MKSIRSAKVKYQDWKKELKEKGTVIEEEVVEVKPQYGAANARQAY